MEIYWYITFFLVSLLAIFVVVPWLAFIIAKMATYGHFYAKTIFHLDREKETRQ